jgi:hypothetical protein
LPGRSFQGSPRGDPEAALFVHFKDKIRFATFIIPEENVCMKLAPVILFVYNRPWHTSQTLNALVKNDLAEVSTLYIMADGPKPGASAEELQQIRFTREVIRSYSGFREIVIKTWDENRGCSGSVIAGVTEIMDRYGRAIVVEDDILTGRGFLKYMNEALNLYGENGEVACIHGFNFPISRSGLKPTFFLRGADCWGWAAWKRSWDLLNQDSAFLLSELKRRKLEHEFNQEGAYNFMDLLVKQVEGRIDSWDIRFHASVFLHGKLTLYPTRSLVRNIGLDGSGIHCGTAAKRLPYTDYCPVQPVPVKESRIALKHLMSYHHPSLLMRIKNKLGRMARA